MGGDFDGGRAFLNPTNELSRSYPCTNNHRCGCYHEVNPHSPHGLVATCQCGGECPAIPLEPKDLIVYVVNRGKLGDAIRHAFGFDSANSDVRHGAPGARQIGTYGTLRAPVFFLCPDSEDALLRELDGLLNGDDAGLILVTPTRAYYSPTVEGVAARAGCVLIPCSMTLAVQTGGNLVVTNPVDRLLADFERRRTEGAALGKTVEKIGQDIHNVATDRYKLQAENAELKALVEGGFLKFVSRVEADDFRAFAAILVAGNRKQAAATLGVAERTFYDRIDGWATRGPEYAKMRQLVDWRKKVGRSITVRLGESLQGSENEDVAENPEVNREVIESIGSGSDSHEEVLRDLLEAIASQNAKNWQSVQTEVVQILREELPQ
jgi:hypothetical protein